MPHEIVVVDDGSRDKTWAVLQELKLKIPTVRPGAKIQGLAGFGQAVICGWNHIRGDACAPMMADALIGFAGGRHSLLAVAQ